MNWRFWAISFSFLMVLPFRSESTEYYVDATSGDDGYIGTDPGATNGTGQGPWQSVAKVVATAKSGDTVYFKRGETWSGSKLYPLDNNITYGAYGDGPLPKIIGDGNDYAAQINSRSGITLQDLELVNDSRTVVFIFNSFDRADNNTVRRCKISVTGSGGSVGGAFGIKIFPSAFPISGYQIDANEFTNSFGGQGLRFEIYGQPISDSVISNNKFHDIKGGALYFFGDRSSASDTSSPFGIDINNNSFTNIDYSAITIGSGFAGVDGHPNYIRNNILSNIGTTSSPNVNALQLNWLRNTIVDHNEISNVMTSQPDGDGIEMDIAFSDPTYSGHNNIVRYNRITGCNAAYLRTSGINIIGITDSLIYGNITYGNQIGISLDTGTPTGNVFYNNVADSNGYGVVATDATLRLGPAPASVWKNNVFSNNSAEGFLVMAGSTLPTEDHNLWFNNGSIWRGTADGGGLYLVGTGGELLSLTDVLADPQFVVPSDYHLAARSPARGAGTPVGVSLDFDGNRFDPAAPDIGAFQSQASLPRILGDLNGDGVVNIADALIALRIAVGIVSPTPTQLALGDVAPLVQGKPAPDGVIDAADALVILEKVVGLKNW